MSVSERYFIEEARHEAEKSNMNHRHGCVIVKNNRIVSMGHNYYYHHCTFNGHTHNNSNRKQKYSVHAEEDAIKNYCRKYTKTKNGPPRAAGAGQRSSLKVYVVRVQQQVTESGESDWVYKNSKPCEMCRRFLSFIEPSKVYYTYDANRAIVEFY